VATGRIVISGADGRLHDAFLPERLTQTELIALIQQHATGGSGGGASIAPDPADPDYILISGSSATLDPADPDYLLIG
jgi:hypothetical protein